MSIALLETLRVRGGVMPVASLDGIPVEPSPVIADLAGRFWPEEEVESGEASRAPTG